MTEREALNLALDAFKTLMIERGSIYDKAIIAIREALAQLEPWEKFYDSNCVWTDHHPDCKLAQPEYQSTADKSKLEKVPAKGTLLAQPEQEPVKFEAVWDSGPTNKDYEDAMRLKRLQQLTAPPQRKPLTEGEIMEIARTSCIGISTQEDTLRFVKAIEAAHGIKRLV